ncbi:aspartate aminotransferase family protein [Chryseosolibacter indicus]|uniref:Aminotransferase class III-fold pyridoxal phosphate-dependent enzyme n=1 Tax=Chryseosolibacter indicus TaxID=2782351 RepID=A0ABS5VQ39_9BACT|nr:aminotransferase class III-fold pyridoxal phosphate-dependent enzyme [Chryseosolibacter indicus]MBT1703547.1 aminotransferase class III-fold pyridoxal phosphate-dependent enzyme [Chryseosolibacter indicus]
MKLFDVYPLFNITPAKAQGSWLWDDKGEKYLDLYGGHAVISIGHSHPHYVKRLSEQLSKIAFYSNSVQNNLQVQFADKLGELSDYPDYQLFLCNSGAEANENALKVASFVTGRKKVIAFKKAFHGRTSGAVAATDNPKIVAPFNAGHEIVFVPLNDERAFDQALNNEVAAVIIEGIQGVGGIQLPDDTFLQYIQKKTEANGSLLILDEIQSGYGRTGKFFAHQHAGIKAHLITTAKGMGNGFPIGGLFIHPDIKPWSGMLGTTFGGNYLASVAGLAVLEVMEKENLIDNAGIIGNYWMNELKNLSQITEVRGRGLMIGMDLPEELKQVRSNLLFNHHIFTGEAKPNTIRLLPSLAITQEEAELFITALKKELK